MINYNDFEKWINNSFAEIIPKEVVALNFNIYEDSNAKWSLEVVGTSSFDEEDDDWACDEITDFNTRETPFYWVEETVWIEVLSEIKGLIQKYLENGKYSEKMKRTNGIGCGFVDGDIEIIYVNR